MADDSGSLRYPISAGRARPHAAWPAGSSSPIIRAKSLVDGQSLWTIATSKTGISRAATTVTGMIT